MRSSDAWCFKQSLCLAILARLLCFSPVHAETAIVEGTWPNGSPYWGYISNHATRAEAVEQALAACQTKAYACAVAKQFHGYCFAVAETSNGSYSIGFANERHEAHNKTLQHCGISYRRDCYIRASECDTVSEDARREELERQAREADEQRQREIVAEQQRLADLERKRTVQTFAVPLPARAVAPAPPAAVTPTDTSQRDYYQRVMKEARAAQSDLLQVIRAGDWEKVFDLLGPYLLLMGLCALVIGVIRNVSSSASATAPGPLALFSSATGSGPPLIPAMRNSQAAEEALELAQSYLQELDDLVPKVMAEPMLAGSMLNTLALASKQIAIAEQADPTALLALDADGASATFSIIELKSQALFVEALARGAEKPRRAIAILEKAVALNPTASLLHFWIGNFHVLLRNKRPAVAAFERAVALDPKNIEYRKELDRARNLAWADIAITKSFKAGRSMATATKSVATIGAFLFLVAAVGSLIANFGVGNVAFWVAAVILMGVTLKIVDRINRL